MKRRLIFPKPAGVYHYFLLPMLRNISILNLSWYPLLLSNHLCTGEPNSGDYFPYCSCALYLLIYLIFPYVSQHVELLLSICALVQQPAWKKLLFFLRGKINGRARALVSSCSCHRKLLQVLRSACLKTRALPKCYNISLVERETQREASCFELRNYCQAFSFKETSNWC